jgi:hypothetical protein
MLVIGRSYAFRAKLARAQPILKTKLIAKVGRRGKVKILYQDGPDPGLEEYIDTRHLLAPRGERAALLRDEKHADCSPRMNETLMTAL